MEVVEAETHQQKRKMKSHGSLIIATTTGLAVGAITAYIMHRFAERIRMDLIALSNKVENLRREVAELKSILVNEGHDVKDRKAIDQGPAPGIRRNRSFISIHGSSDDEEDDFLEAWDTYS